MENKFDQEDYEQPASSGIGYRHDPVSISEFRDALNQRDVMLTPTGNFTLSEVYFVL